MTLVERLRLTATEWDGFRLAPMLTQAADALEAAERRAEEDTEFQLNRIIALRHELTQAEAREAVMREALENLALSSKWSGFTLEAAGKIARAALNLRKTEATHG